MEIVLNERECAEYHLENNSLGQRPSETLSRIARYYAAEGYNNGEICRLLEEFILKCDPTACIVKWQNAIDTYARSSGKIPLAEIEYIPITKKEMDICDSLDGKPQKRIMFTLVCLAKYYNAVNENNGNWVNKRDDEILKLANVTRTVKERSLMFNDFRELGLIRFSKKVDNVNINVTCIDNDGDTVLKITDFRNLGYQYLKYHGESYFECESCGLTVRRTGNRQKYCKDCASEINRKKSWDSWKNSLAG